MPKIETLPVTPIDKIGIIRVCKEFTKKTGDYENAKVRIEVELPIGFTTEQLNAANVSIKKLSDFVDKKMMGEVEKIG
jgi:ribosomal protein L11